MHIRRCLSLINRYHVSSMLLCCLASQSESLRNLVVSEAADWQVLTLRLAVQLQALKSSTPDDESLGGNNSKYKQAGFSPPGRFKLNLLLFLV